ncbi:MAG: PrsW family intramembrane metalloprotease, partial [Acidobacteria bacterium]|nr:PrsW family intramembrane metalloprotease [Acidobacteriota bacterium]
MTLYIRFGSLAGRNFELTNGVLTVGRGENCAVRFDPLTERIASKEHAFIEAKTDGFYLFDNQSRNGTLLNGEKIQNAKLNHGDRIQFGRSGIEATVKIESDSYPSEPTILKPAFQLPNNFQPAPANQFPRPPSDNWRNSIAGLGAGHIREQSQTNQTGKYIGVAVAIFSTVFLSLILILRVFASVGIGAALIASVVAFVPAMVYLLPLLWLDRYDPEPFWLLSMAFAWGALVAVIVSFIVNTILGSFLGETFGAVVSAPVFEEGSKGLGLVLLLVFFRRYFDDILDGIVFAGVIALGFSTVENVLYYGRGILEGGSDALVVLFVLRGIMSPFAHVSFTAMTGIGCGIARESHNKAVRLLMPIIGYICAVLLHAIWNGAAVIGEM